ncbi:putative disease resistance RPP13-like protein 1 [Glycine max]|nr:putative disease resistance RPP13-like protein 1 [Glycine max]
MEGFGKTMLAQHLYKDPNIQVEYDIKNWIFALHEFYVFKLTKNVLEAISNSTKDPQDFNLF